MKIDPTTIAGMVAGAALAVAALPGLPKSITAAAGLIGAASVGALGWHAKTCPPNCPGTDGLGNPVRQIPSTFRRIVPVACFLVLLAALARISHDRIEQRSGESVRRLDITQPNDNATRRFFCDRL
jgi:hypothetical protein